MSTMTLEREAFEESLKTGDILTDLRNRTKRNGIYVSDRIQARWEGWQARAHLAQPAQAVDVEAIETVIRSMCNGEYVEGRHVLADILHRALTGKPL